MSELELPLPPSSSLEEVNTWLLNEQQVVSDRLKAIERAQRAVSRILGFESDAKPIHALSAMKTEFGEKKDPTPALAQYYPEKTRNLSEALASKKEFLSERAQDVLREYPLLIGEAATKAGLEFDRSSQHPRYQLAGGFFRLTIDDKKRVAILQGPERKYPQIPADVTTVIRLVQGEIKRVCGRSLDRPKYIAKILAVYRSFLKASGQEIGAPMPVRTLLRALLDKSPKYQPDEFSYDLADVVTNGPLECEGLRMEIQHTRENKAGMLLFGGGTGAYVGFVLFRKVGNE